MKYLKLFEDNEKENKFIDAGEEVDSQYTDYFDESEDNELDFDDLLDKFKRENAEETHIDSISRTVEEKISEDIISYVNKHPYVNVSSSDFLEVVSSWAVDAEVRDKVRNKFDDEISDNRDWIEENLRKFVKEEPNNYITLKENDEELYTEFQDIVDDILDEFEDDYGHLTRVGDSGLMNANKK